jgi:hypothetical protein
MRLEFVRRTASDAHDEFGIYAVSVFLALDESVEDLCASEPFLSRTGESDCPPLAGSAAPGSP